MSTNLVLVPAVDPNAPPKASKLAGIVNVINLALQGITMVGPLAGPIGIEAAAAAMLAEKFTAILQHALTAYQAETGQPIDLSKIPLEALVP